MLRPATPGWGPPLCGGGWPLATPGRGAWLRGPATPGWGPPPVAVVGPSPLPAVGRGRGSPPLLAGVHWLWWWRPWVPFSLVLVFVCAVWPFVLVSVALRGLCAVWLPCVCLCVIAVCRWWGVSYPGWFFVVGPHGRVQKAEEEKQ